MKFHVGHFALGIVVGVIAHIGWQRYQASKNGG